MNTYKTEFYATCPTNGVRVKYHLEINSCNVVRVEEIIAAVDLMADKFHEEIADEMHQRFGGHQTLSADHHSVQIVTTRPYQVLS